jgi:hypothetical protein
MMTAIGVPAHGLSRRHRLSGTPIERFTLSGRILQTLMPIASINGIGFAYR